MGKMVEIVERMRDVLEDNSSNKVMDKNIAYELGIGSLNLSTKKSRNLIPYHHIILFCIKYNVSTDWLFFGTGDKRRECAKEDM